MSVDVTITVNLKDYGFDFADQRIDVDATVDSLILGDLWTAIKAAMSHPCGIPFRRIASGEGLATLGTGVQTFLTVTLLDSWEVNTLKTSGKFEVGGGNLIRQDGEDPFRDNPLITYIAFLSQAGIATQVETGVSGLTASESAKLLSLDTSAVNVTEVAGTAVAGVDDFKADVSAIETKAQADTRQTALITGIAEVLVQAELARKGILNRFKISSDNTGIIYDDDGLTPLVTFDLKDINGVAAYINSTERVPQ